MREQPATTTTTNWQPNTNDSKNALKRKKRPPCMEYLTWTISRAFSDLTRPGSRPAVTGDSRLLHGLLLVFGVLLEWPACQSVGLLVVPWVSVV